MESGWAYSGGGGELIMGVSHIVVEKRGVDSGWEG